MLAVHRIRIVPVETAIGHDRLTLAGRKIVCTSRRNRATPKIMITTVISRPTLSVMVMSPKPVVVSVVTVK